MTGGSDLLFRGALLFVVLATAAVLGAALAWSPGLPTLLVLCAVVGLGGLALYGRRASPAALAFGALVFLHYLNVSRSTLLNDWLFGIPRLVRIPTIIAVVGVLVLVRGPELTRGVGRAALGTMVPWLLWLFVAAVLGLWPARSLFWTAGLLFLLLSIALTMTWFPNPTDFWRRWCKAIAIGSGALTGLSVLAIVAGASFAGSDRWAGGQLAASYRGVLDHGNHLGAVACVAAGSALALLQGRTSDRLPRWLLGFLVLCGGAVLASGSRGALLGFSTGLLYFFLRGGGSGQSLKRYRMVVGSVMATLLVLGLAFSDVGRTHLARLTETPETLEAGEEARTAVWATYLRSFVTRPAFGTGYGASPARADRMVVRSFDEGEHLSHNVFIEYGMTTGVLGLVLFCWVLAGVVQGLRRPSARPFRQSVACFAATIWPAYLLQTTGGSLNELGSWPFWVPLLVARAFVAVDEPEEVSDLAPVVALR